MHPVMNNKDKIIEHTMQSVSNHYDIISNKQVGTDMYIMTIKGDFEGMPGQFYMIRGVDSFMTLSRPLSIFDIDKAGSGEDGHISFLYKVCGRGTAYFSSLRKDDGIILYGPYGRGFPVEEYKHKKVLLAGGGMGCAPLVFAARYLKNADLKISFREGAMNQDQKEDFFAECAGPANTSLHIDADLTEDIDMDGYDAVMSCGPEAMMKKLTEKHPNTYVSLEKHMGCAVGACLSCTCEVDGKRVRVCKEGPVFKGSEVRFDG